MLLQGQGRAGWVSQRPSHSQGKKKCPGKKRELYREGEILEGVEQVSMISPTPKKSLHVLSKHLLRTYYGQALSGPGDRAVNKTHPRHEGMHLLVFGHCSVELALPSPKALVADGLPWGSTG